MIVLSRRYRAGLVVGGIFMLGMLFCQGVFKRVVFIFTAGGDSARFEYWHNTLALIKRHPLLGHGIGTFMDRIHAQAPHLMPLYAHNCYLQILAETGIFSLIFFVSFLLFVLIKAVISYKENKDPLLLGLIGGSAGFLLHAFFDNHFYSVPLAFQFWIIFGMMVAHMKQSCNSAGTDEGFC